MTDERGVQFPLVDGRRSTTQLSRDVFATAVADVDQRLAVAIADERAWHTAYAEHLRTLTARAAERGEHASAIARAGLDRLHEQFVVVDGDGTELPIDEAVAREPAAPLDTRAVDGTRDRAAELVVPHRGRRLTGDAIVAQAREWHDAGVVEASFVEAIGRVVANPDWLDLRGQRFAVLGAAAEMGPTGLLLAWGADVWAVDLPVPRVWSLLEQLARDGAGRLHAPVREDGTDGVDLIAEPERARAWLAGIDGPLTIGNYAYADGADFVRVAMAADAAIVAVQRERPKQDVALGYLATPTDVFAVPMEAVEHARRRYADAGALGAVGRLVHRVADSAFVPNHRRTITTEDGTELGIADCLVLQQGPNYALAKRLQRWRSLVARQDGHTSAVNVAPATTTRSVTKNRLLAAAYAGAHVVDVEPFEPATSRAIMAAMLVHDLHHGSSVATVDDDGGGTQTEHDLTDGAAHSGLWRTAWEPRSALGVAVAAGAPRLLRA